MRDDLSGSTRVLAHAIEALTSRGFEVELYAVCLNYPGFLSRLKDVNYRTYPYQRYKSRLRTFLAYLYAQFYLFFTMLSYGQQPVTVYINTVLPFGPALAARLLRKKVVYHIHETSLAPAPAWLRFFLFKMAEICASEVIHVSEYLKSQREVRRANNHVIHNSVSPEFGRVALNHLSKRPQVKMTPCILMVCSLAPYKGIAEFRVLAERIPEYRFQLILNATQEEFKDIYANSEWPVNVEVFFNQSNVHPFYQKASVLVNLSLPDKHVETFGMTVLEGMTYGLPVIVPPVGGVTELVDSGQNGYRIDARNLDRLVASLKEICSNKALYEQMSASAIKKSRTFKSESFNEAIVSVFTTSPELAPAHG